MITDGTVTQLALMAFYFAGADPMFDVVPKEQCRALQRQFLSVELMERDTPAGQRRVLLIDCRKIVMRPT